MHITLEIPDDPARVQPMDAAFEAARQALSQRLAGLPSVADWQLSQEEATTVMAALAIPQLPGGTVAELADTLKNMRSLELLLEGQTVKMARMNWAHFWVALLMSACFVAAFAFSPTLVNGLTASFWFGTFVVQLWLHYRRPPQQQASR